MINSLQNRSDILQNRFALKATSYLSAGTADLPYDISERLRAARVQAVSKRKMVQSQSATSVVSVGNSAALTWGGDEGFSGWSRIALVFPFIALVVGLLTINSVQIDNRAQEVAEVDTALLIDELPPAAFADPGFVQFLKSTR